MSRSLVRSGGLLPSRQVGRALERIDAETLVAARRDEARLDRVAGTARRGMVRAAEIGLLEDTLGRLNPHAAAYVHISATAGAMGIAGVVYDAARGR